MTDKTDSKEREAIIRAAVAAMPHTNPLVADDLLGGFTMHTEADDIVAIYLAGRASLAANAGREPVAWTGGEEWEQLAWHLCAEEHGEDACDEVIWEGGPIPEPWGARWMKYESDAKRMIELVRRFYANPSPPEGMVGGWMPIETAPKDGTHILLVNQDGVSEGGWLTDMDHGADWEGQIGMAGWWRTDGTDWPNTHWMPLPPPPTSSADSRKGD